MSNQKNEHEISRSQQRNLQAISRIDDEIIDKNTGKRIVLLAAAHRRAKKKWTAIVSAAASLVLIVTALLSVIPLLAKHVPIYTGMTVSDKAPVTMAEGMLLSQFVSDTENGGASGQKNVSGNHTDADQTIGEQPFDTAIGDVVGTPAVEVVTDRYYTVPNADIYITIHIDNPDQFEILSFTLNGKKYQNNMFEYGSDLENIVLKLNVGDVEGVVSYTIDAIKYVDGTDIKDVKMEGERTVEIGVYTEKQPAALLSDTVSGFDMISFTVELSDTMNLLASLVGDVKAVLFDGNSIIAEQMLAATGKSTVTFRGLMPNKLYECAVIADYDALDGKGVARHVIASRGIYTKALLLFDGVKVGTKSVSYTFLWDADVSDGAVRAVALYQNGEKLRDIDPTATEVTGLTVDTTYTLVATYQRGGKDEQISITFTTGKLIVTVNQYLENLDGTYTLIDTLSESVKEGTVYTPLLGSLEGFTTPTVAPVTLTDASHVFDCYFKRNVCDITFIDNNGSIKTEQLKFGMPLVPATMPVRDGFIFGGWFTDAGLMVAAGDTVPAQAITVYAKWLFEASPADLSFTVSGGKVTVTGLLNQGITDLIIPAYIAGQPVIAIGAGAFRDKTTLRTVVLPDTVTEIGDSAFAYSGITAITLSKNLITIDSYAFNFTRLTTLTIPASVASIGSSAFEDCAWLTSITFEDRSTPLTVDMWAFRMTGAAGVEAQLERVIVEDLADWFNIAFHTGDVPTNPLHLGAALYHGSEAVTTLVIPEGVTSIRPHLFAGCTTLTSVVIPVSVISVQNSAFADCTNLQSVIFDAGSRAGIFDSAFRGCSRLSTINLPALGEIVSNTFANCPMLASLEIPASVTRIEPSAFENCGAVTVVNGISYVGGWALGGTPTDGSLALRAGTVGIADSAFENLAVRGTLTLPDGLKYIGDSAFSGFACGGGVLTIPDSVVRVGGRAFDGSSFADEDTETGLVYADKWLVNADNYYGWNYLDDLRADTVGIANSTLLKVDVDSTGTLIIPEGIQHLGGGAILIYAGNGAPTLHLPASLLTITYGSISFDGSSGYWQGITVAAGNTAYSGVGNCLVEKATGTLLLGSATSVIPTDGSVTSIGAHAFENCRGLTAIHIPASVIEIKTSAFSYCNGLTTLTFAENSRLKVIGIGAFLNCRGLTAIHIPASVIEIKSSAFSSCNGLTTLTFAENSRLKVIWNGAFQNCPLTSVVLPNGLTTLYHAAFGLYKDGAYIVVPTSVTSANLSFEAPNGIIYYYGEAGAVADMILPPSRIHDYNMAIYYYSATKPAVDHGSYWHWVGDVPTVWSAND